MTDISEAGSTFVRDLGGAARKNPLSAALIGMGVLWLFTGNRAAEKAGTAFQRTGNRIAEASGDAFEAASASLKSGASSIGSGITSAAESLQDSAGSAVERVSPPGRGESDAAFEYCAST